MKIGDTVYDWDKHVPNRIYTNKVINFREGRILGYFLDLKDTENNTVTYELGDNDLDKSYLINNSWCCAIGIEGILRCLNENF